MPWLLIVTIRTISAHKIFEQKIKFLEMWILSLCCTMLRNNVSKFYIIGSHKWKGSCSACVKIASEYKWNNVAFLKFHHLKLFAPARIFQNSLQNFSCRKNKLKAPKVVLQQFLPQRLRRNNFCSWIKLGFILFTNWTKLDFLLIELLLWPKRSAQRKDNWDWDCMKLAQKYKWNNATLLIYSLSCLHLCGFPRYPKLPSKE